MREPEQHVFNSIISHEIPKNLLMKMIEKERIPNALVISGAEGIGKKSLAFSFIKILNCLSDEKGKDNCACVNCRKTREKKSIDLYHLIPAGALYQIGVDEIRAFHDNAGIYPAEYKRKVLFIHDADRLNTSAANALLKLLEEPPDHLIIVLFTKNLTQLLPTIRSRCMLVQLHPVPVNEISAWLINELKISSKDANIAAYFSEGSPAKAVLAASGDLAAKRKKMHDIMDFFFTNGEEAIPATSCNLINNFQNTQEIFNLALIWQRDVMMYSLLAKKGKAEMSFPDGVIINIDNLSEVIKDSEKMSPEKAFNILKLISEKFHLTQRITNPDLLLRNLLYEMHQIIS